MSEPYEHIAPASFRRLLCWHGTTKREYATIDINGRGDVITFRPLPTGTGSNATIVERGPEAKTFSDFREALDFAWGMAVWAGYVAPSDREAA